MTRVKKILIYGAAGIMLIALIGGGFLGGLRLGEQRSKNIIIRGVKNLEPNQSTTADFAAFWEAWQMLNEQHLKNKEISNQDRVYGAIEGLAKSFKDPYTDFFPPADSKKFQEDIDGNFGGIGAEIGIKKDRLMVIAPLKDTPAEKAGLRNGDQILKIDDTYTDDLTVDEAVKLIRGPAGTEVKLLILRSDWERPKEFKITRGQISVPTLDYEFKDDNRIIYVKLYNFNTNANYLFYQAVLKAAVNGSQGMILDLRNNPGGYLEVAVDLAGWFLKRGEIVVSEENQKGINQVFRARGNAALADFPVAVLINQGSASASEILAGALRDQRQIKLIGEKSVGKGTVQQLLELKDGSSLKITVAHWVLPGGKILEGDGLIPDIEIKMTDEDFEKKRDPQLDKAVEILELVIKYL